MVLLGNVCGRSINGSKSNARSTATNTHKHFEYVIDKLYAKSTQKLFVFTSIGAYIAS